MEAEWKPLARYGGNVLTKFLELIDACSKGQEESFTQHQAKFQHEQERFQLFAANMGLVQQGHSSLDYRLRESDLLQSSVRRLLEDLDGSLGEAFQLFTDNGHDMTATSSPDDVHCDPDSSDFVTETHEDEDELLEAGYGADEDVSTFELICGSITDAIDRLFQLATKVRNPRTRQVAERVYTYKNIDPETGVNLIDEYAKYDLQHTVQLFSGPFEASTKDSQHYLVDRLSQANVLRRQQFGHWRRRRSKLQPMFKRNVGELSLREMPRVNWPSVAGELPNPGEVPSKIATSKPYTASMLDPATINFSDNKSTVSVSEYAPTATGLGNESVSWPLPSSKLMGTKHFECPYCYTLCPRSYLEDKSWRKHLLRDLQPYMCTYEHCPDAKTLYGTRIEWVAHEDSMHRRIWRCLDHVETTFQNRDAYENHLRLEHVQEAHLHSFQLLKAGESISSVPDRPCPFCQAEFTDSTALQNHISFHLERVARFAFPRSTCVDDDSISSEPGSADAAGYNETLENEQLNSAGLGSLSGDSDASKEKADDKLDCNSVQTDQKNISRNRLGQRIDEMDETLSNEEIKRVKKLKLCNIHFLNGADACTSARCTHYHEYNITKNELRTLRQVARMTPCFFKTECDDPKCIYGHRCPQSQSNSKDCWYKEDCRFAGWGHGIDTRITALQSSQELNHSALKALEASTSSNQGAHMSQFLQGLGSDKPQSSQRQAGMEYLTYGSESNGLASARALAAKLLEQRRWKDAEDGYRKILEVVKAVRGQRAPQTLQSMLDLASVYRHQTLLDQAEELCIEASRHSRDLSGDDSNQFIINYELELASIKQHQGRLYEAQERSSEAFRRSEEFFGKDNIHTQKCLLVLASISLDQGSLADAEALGIQALETSKRMGEEGTEFSLECLHQLALTYAAQYRWEEAEDLQAQAVAIAKELNGLDDVKTLNQMTHHSFILGKQGRWKEAIELGRCTIDLYRIVMGPDSTETLRAVDALEDAQRQYIQQKRQILSSAEKLFVTNLMEKGEDHEATLEAMASLVSIHADEETWKETTKFQQDFFRQYRSCWIHQRQPTHFLLRLSGILVDVYARLSWWGDAIRLQERIVRANHDFRARNHPDTVPISARFEQIFRRKIKEQADKQRLIYTEQTDTDDQAPVSHDFSDSIDPTDLKRQRRVIRIMVAANPKISPQKLAPHIENLARNEVRAILTKPDPGYGS